MQSINQKAERALVHIIEHPSRVTDVSFWINPTNATVERRKFLEALEQHNTYEPQLEYPPLTFDPHDFFEQLSRIQVDETEAWGRLLARTREYLANKVLLIAARGNKGIVQMSQMVYAAPSAAILERALKILKPAPAAPKQQRYLWPEEVVTHLRRSLAEMRLKTWNVKLREQVSLAEVDSAQRTLWVDASPSHPYTEATLQLLVVHEIKTHIRRHENGLRSGHPLLALGTAGYLLLEEGLAVHEEMHSSSTAPTMNDYAILAIAICKANESTFSQTFTYLTELNEQRKLGYEPQRLVSTVLRIKRGLADTSQVGAYSKDLLYLLGYEAVDGYLKRGGEHELLFLGKISLEDLELFKDGRITSV